MSECPNCHAEFEAAASGQLCPKCVAEVLAKDVYTSGDLRFVGFLAGALTAAVSSMPGAMVGYVIGRAFNEGTRGCTIGVIVFSLLGLVAGFLIGPRVVRQMETAKRAKAAAN